LAEIIIGPTGITPLKIVTFQPVSTAVSGPNGVERLLVEFESGDGYA